MEKKENKQLTRREFLTRLGLGAAITGAALAGCSPRRKEQEPEAERETSAAEMTYRTNPTTGDRVSLLGYGCMRWPLEDQKDRNSPIDQEATNRLVDYAIEHGVNYFDTAPVYGRGLSERVTGIALKRHPREKFFIATKLSNTRIYTFEKAKEMYDKSFRELQVDYIDYYLLHSIGGGSGIPAFRERFIDNGVLDFLLKEREAGRIRNLGFSFHGDVKTFDYALTMHDKVHWDFVQIQLNYVDWMHATRRNVDAEYLYAELSKRGIPSVIMEPLLGGRLASLNNHLTARLKQERPDESVASWAFRFAGTPEQVLTVLSGMTYQEHLEDNLRTYSPLEPCTDRELELLEDTAQRYLKYPLINCNDCMYCMPCPYGLDIPAIFGHYNKCINEGNVSASSGDPDYRRARRAFLVGYDRAVPPERQASRCIGCEECIPTCPQSLDIPRLLQRVDAYVEDLKQGKEL
ncbi:MAG: aldo/keto reductase [Rikenellaceae bacterium]|nr:aldo/keto reductase [Rikenellaceae bacterium]